jgi:hypothetical protein
VQVCSVSQFAKNQDHTCTCGTHLGNTAGLPISMNPTRATLVCACVSTPIVVVCVHACLLSLFACATVVRVCVLALLLLLLLAYKYEVFYLLSVCTLALCIRNA